MTRKQGQPALPQLKAMLGKAVADRAASERPRKAWIRRAPLRTKLAAGLVATASLGVIAVGAGALDRTPVAPQLSPEESGVKPGVVPGEVQILEMPNGEKVEAGVSPCIKSDPAGYSSAELEEAEWCFHAPGAVGNVSRSNSNPGADANRGTVIRRMPDGSFKVWRRPAE